MNLRSGKYCKACKYRKENECASLFPYFLSCHQCNKFLNNYHQNKHTTENLKPMNLIEAIKSGKPFKRHSWSKFRILNFNCDATLHDRAFFYDEESMSKLNIDIINDDIFAEDYILKEEENPKPEFNMWNDLAKLCNKIDKDTIDFLEKAKAQVEVYPIDIKVLLKEKYKLL